MGQEMQCCVHVMGRKEARGGEIKCVSVAGSPLAMQNMYIAKSDY